MVAVRPAADAHEVPAAILRLQQGTRQGVNRIGMLRINPDVAVVERAEVRVRIFVDHPPRRARIIGAPHFAFGCSFADRIDDVRVALRHTDADAIHGPFGQAPVRVRA